MQTETFEQENKARAYLIRECNLVMHTASSALRKAAKTGVYKGRGYEVTFADGRFSVSR
jgi:hypothetical protein